MAKDDYFVVMYQLLKVLYEALKRGEQISDEVFGEQLITLNEKYWNFIVQNMADDGYITGVFTVHPTIGNPNGTGLKYHNVTITPQGIEFLFSNSMMERVKNALKDIKGIIPGM